MSREFLVNLLRFSTLFWQLSHLVGMVKPMAAYNPCAYNMFGSKASLHRDHRNILLKAEFAPGTPRHDWIQSKTAYGEGKTEKSAQIAAAKEFICNYITEQKSSLQNNLLGQQNAKTQLNNWAQKQDFDPVYTTMRTGGNIFRAAAQLQPYRQFRSTADVHSDQGNILFKIEDLDLESTGSGQGLTKKEAESAAAQEFLQIYINEPIPSSQNAKVALNNLVQKPGFSAVYTTKKGTGKTFHSVVQLQRRQANKKATKNRKKQSAADENKARPLKIDLSKQQERSLRAALEAGSALPTLVSSQDRLSTSSKVEKRIDRDGSNYTRAEFQDFYGPTWLQHWNAAIHVKPAQSNPRLPQATVPPQVIGSLAMKSVREALPVFKHRRQILQAVSNSQVVIIEGETGCGKTTQIGQFILEDAAGKRIPCSIVCTQPRRISAIGVAERVAAERGESVGHSVGYSVRQEHMRGPHTRLLFCTTGILLRRLEADADLDGTTHVMVDEVHERSIETDFLLLALRDLSKRRSDLKIVLMSATMDKDLLSEYFSGAPHIVIPGRTFPVQTFFLEDALNITKHIVKPTADWALGRATVDTNNADAGKREDLGLAQVAKRYKNYGPGVHAALSGIEQDVVNYDLLVALIRSRKLQELADTATSGRVEGAQSRPDGVLVFLSGAKQIETLKNALLYTPEFRAEPARSWVLTLHGGLSSVEQKKAFLHPPPGVRKIVLSTNVAETSVTIDDIGYVIDSCRMNEVRYDPASKIVSLVDTVVSRTNARQRRGRAGRVAPGIAVHVGLTRFRHNELVDNHQAPEVQRVSLEQFILRIYALGMHMHDGSGKAEHVCAHMLEPPKAISVQQTLRNLVGLGALDIDASTGHQSLTALGKHLARLPLDACLGKFLLHSTAFGAAAVDAALTIVAALTSRSPFRAPLESRDEADEARQGFALKMVGGCIGPSDHMAVLAAYSEWNALSLGGNLRWEFCQRNFLCFKTLTIMSETKRSLLQTLSEAGFAKRGIRAENLALLAQRHGGDGVLLALSGTPVRPCPPTLVAALLSAALSTQVAKAAVVGKKKKKKKQTTIYSVRDIESGDQVQVQMFPGSVCAIVSTEVSEMSSPFFVYQELARTSPYVVWIRGVTPVPPLALVLFAARLTVAAEKETPSTSFMIIDDWIELEISRSACESLIQVRHILDSLWLHWFLGEDDGRMVFVERHASHLLRFILAFLSIQGNYAPTQVSKQDSEALRKRSVDIGFSKDPTKSNAYSGSSIKGGSDGMSLWSGESGVSFADRFGR